jgi:hypothetical protein
MSVELIEKRVLSKSLEEVPPIHPSGFSSDLNGVETSLGGGLDYLSDESISSGTVIIGSRGGREDLPFAIHDTEGVCFSVDVNAHQERVRHFHHLFSECT